MRKLALLSLSIFVFVGCTTTQPTEDNQDSGITSAEIENHNSETDCWIAINGSVYDATSYISEHPAGSESIIRGCGSIYSEEEFNEITPHKNAGDLLQPMLEGTLAE